MRKLWIGVVVGAVGGAVLGLLRDSAHQAEHDCETTGEVEPDSERRPGEGACRVQGTVESYAF